jgi:hypothetical protein
MPANDNGKKKATMKAKDLVRYFGAVNAPHPKGWGFYRFYEEIASPISEC